MIDANTRLVGSPVDRQVWLFDGKQVALQWQAVSHVEVHANEWKFK